MAALLGHRCGRPLLGSLLEIALLAAVIYYAWTWPKVPSTTQSHAATTE